MNKVLVLLALAGAALHAEAAAPTQSPLEIQHEPLACVTPKLAPRVEAAVAPGQEYEKSFVYFRAANTEDFYYVLMNGAPASLAGILPRPLPVTPAIDYYVQALDKEELSKKTPEYVPPVVPTEGVCKKTSGIAVGAAGAGLTIGLTRENQDPIPAGFNRRDVARVILVSGAIVSIADALAQHGKTVRNSSGGKTTALVVGGVILAGGAVAIAANNNGGGGTSPPSVTVSATPTSGPAPLAVAFHANVTGGSSPFSFLWAFGDGGTSTLADAGHVYSSPGAYTATVTVTDRRGRSATASATVTASGPPPLLFFEADASWSGLGDLDLGVLNASGTPVGQPFRVGCGPTENRTERVVLQGAALVPGTYSITLTGNSCGPGTPTSISGIVNVVTDQGGVASCANVVAAVAIGETRMVCQFVVP